jgi:ABC-2 type transport system permease protein
MSAAGDLGVPGGDGRAPAALAAAGRPTLAPASAVARRRRVLSVVLRDYYVLRRSAPRMLEIVYWPTVELLIWGYLSVFLQARRVPAVVAVLLGGVLLWQVLFRSQSEVSMAFLEDIWSRNLLNVFVAPLTASEYLTGVVAFGALKLVVNVALTAVIALVLYGFGLFSIGPALVPFMALLLLMGWALAIVTIGVILRFGQSAEVIAWAMAFAFQPFAAVFYPVAVLPVAMQWVAHVVPASYVFEGMRAVLAGRPMPWGTLGMAALLDLVYVAGALVYFRRMLVKVRANGGLSRFGE